MEDLALFQPALFEFSLLRLKEPLIQMLLSCDPFLWIGPDLRQLWQKNWKQTFFPKICEITADQFFKLRRTRNLCKYVSQIPKEALGVLINSLFDLNTRSKSRDWNLEMAEINLMVQWSSPSRLFSCQTTKTYTTASKMKWCFFLQQWCRSKQSVGWTPKSARFVSKQDLTSYWTICLFCFKSKLVSG